MFIRENPRIPILAGVATAATAAFAWLAVLERDRRLAKADGEGLEKIAGPDGKHKEVAPLLHPLGKWWSYVPAAAVAGATVYARGSGGRRERAAGAGAVLLAAAAGALACPVFDRVLPQPPTPPRRRADPKPTFPSGHATGVGAVAMTAAYVLRREGIIGGAAAVPLALMPPVVSGLARVVERKHWPSEVAGGLLAAVVISSFSSLVYELERAERPGEAERA
jgi:membrane-associated phospholipid phosphatase